MANQRVRIAVALSVFLAGCAGTVPYRGQGPHPQIERGAAFAPVDALGNLLALPSKLILWEWRFANHYISPETEEHLVEYLAARDLEALDDTHFRLNQYRPILI